MEDFGQHCPPLSPPYSEALSQLEGLVSLRDELWPNHLTYRIVPHRYLHRLDITGSCYCPSFVCHCLGLSPLVLYSSWWSPAVTTNHSSSSAVSHCPHCHLSSLGFIYIPCRHLPSTAIPAIDLLSSGTQDKYCLRLPSCCLYL